jgi:hypothetical protein
MALCGNRNQKKKQQAKDVEAWVKRDSKDEAERSFGCRSAFTMEDGMERGHHMERAMKRWCEEKYELANRRENQWIDGNHKGKDYCIG